VFPVPPVLPVLPVPAVSPLDPPDPPVPAESPEPPAPVALSGDELPELLWWPPPPLLQALRPTVRERAIAIADVRQMFVVIGVFLAPTFVVFDGLSVSVADGVFVRCLHDSLGGFGMPFCSWY
jgi:hypothetical protein